MFWSNSITPYQQPQTLFSLDDANNYLYDEGFGYSENSQNSNQNQTEVMQVEKSFSRPQLKAYGHLKMPEHQKLIEQFENTINFKDKQIAHHEAHQRKMTALIDNLNKEIKKMDSKAKEDAVRIANMETLATNNLKNFLEVDAENKNRIQNLEAQNYNYTNRVKVLGIQLNTCTYRNGELETKIAEHAKRIAEMEVEASNDKNRIGQLEKLVNQDLGLIDALETTNNSHLEKIIVLEGKEAKFDLKEKSLQHQIQNLESMNVYLKSTNEDLESENKRDLKSSNTVRHKKLQAKDYELLPLHAVTRKQLEKELKSTPSLRSQIF